MFTIELSFFKGFNEVSKKHNIKLSWSNTLYKLEKFSQLWINTNYQTGSVGV